MKIIKILTDGDFGIDKKEMTNPKIRIGARGLVFNHMNQIAIINKTLKNEYKLVGGGVDTGENPLTAFKREVLEESGCEVEVEKYLGIIEEHKSQDNFKQISHIFIASVISNTKELNLTKKEVDEGTKLLWLDLDSAIRLIKKCETELIASNYEDLYHSRFIVRRDYEILKYYKKQIL